MMALNAIALISALLLHQSVAGLKFVTVGDWGDSNASGIENQKVIAQQMSNWCGVEECAFIVSAGDNFYPQGVTSITDARFDTSWRWIYNLTNIDTKQWFMSIGNHDHDGSNNDGREWFQVEFSTTVEPRWYFPGLWYDLHYSVDGVNIHFVVVDTESLRLNRNDPAAQLAWLEDTLAASTADWKFVVAHHPPYSAGNYGPGSGTIRDQLVPILLRYGVHVLLSGHDHNLQHMYPTVGGGIDYIISGGGGRGLYPFYPEDEDLLNGMGISLGTFEYIHGFVAFEFTATTMFVQFVDRNGDVIYTINRSK